MKNAKKSKFLFTILLSVIICVLSFLTLFSNNNRAFAIDNCEVLYSDELYADVDYTSTAEEVVASYDVYFDKLEETEYICHINAPSFGNTDTSKTNACAPLAGLNIVGFYDRWYENLIPNYNPGMVFADGTYHYFPDMGSSATKNTFSSLYSLMKTGVLGGTTSSNFKSGLNSYVSGAGHNISYLSFYSSSTSVNLTMLAEAIRNNRVGLIMCSEYNFVSDILYNDSFAHITKRNNAVGHMMMVYGYRIITYYKDDAVIRRDTFLNVCSSYSTAEVGFMQLYDYSVINEALIVSIS